MTSSGDPKSPIDQLVDLFVYAPLGFLYERDEVLDKVVTRGKSQVQLARLMAKMASQQSGGTEAMVGDAVSFAADVVSKGITEFGVALGLVPKPPPASSPSTFVDVDETTPSDDRSDGDLSAEDTFVDDADLDDADLDEGGDELDESGVLAIADYDSMTARDIIAALEGLSPSEITRIADHERSGRNRKTILAKADRLVG